MLVQELGKVEAEVVDVYVNSKKIVGVEKEKKEMGGENEERGRR